jgi:hypothetical protein
MSLQFAIYTEAAAAACRSFCSGALVRTSRGRGGLRAVRLTSKGVNGRNTVHSKHSLPLTSNDFHELISTVAK